MGRSKCSRYTIDTNLLLWYTKITMDIDLENLPPVPQGTPTSAMSDNETVLYDFMLRVQLEGLSIKKAIKDAPFSSATYFRWQRENREWFDAVKTRAQADAIQMTKDAQHQVLAKRIRKQIEADDLLLENILDVLSSMIAEAKDGNDKAAKLVIDATRKGAVFERETDAPELPSEPAGLAYNPHETGPAQLLKLSVPQGTEVTIKTQDPVLDLPATDVE